ncbi:MAG TPA: glutamate--tRNA ligase, partial [Spirochaetales bacterium]|nr:glutamate--tRNA ligase [Spirochaetales bacterium]
DFDVPPQEELIPKKLDKTATARVLLEAKALLIKHGVSDHAVIEQAFRTKAEELGYKLGDMLMPLRMAVTGTKVSPPLFESIALVGIEKACARIDAAVQVLQK